MRETRAFPVGELRTGDDGRHYFTARICNYNVPDSYRTSWAPGVFKRSLDEHLPTAVFSHQWDRPIGKVVDYVDGPDGLDVTVRMSDLEVNPDAKRMYHHLKDQEIEEFSFAFERRGEEPDPTHQGVTRILEATMDEVSPVLRGSVPGTRVLAVRSVENVSKRDAANILVKFSQGELDLADALQAIKATAPDGGNPGTGEGGPDGDQKENNTEFETPMPPDPSPPEQEDTPVQDDVLAKLETLARSKRKSRR